MIIINDTPTGIIKDWICVEGDVGNFVGFVLEGDLETDGDSVGSALGDNVGESEGNNVGESKDDIVRESEGNTVGKSEGDDVGHSEGNNAGESESDNVGESESDNAGFSSGTFLIQIAQRLVSFRSSFQVPSPHKCA